MGGPTFRLEKRERAERSKALAKSQLGRRHNEPEGANRRGRGAVPTLINHGLVVKDAGSGTSEVDFDYEGDGYAYEETGTLVLGGGYNALKLPIHAGTGLPRLVSPSTVVTDANAGQVTISVAASSTVGLRHVRVSGPTGNLLAATDEACTPLCPGDVATTVAVSASELPEIRTTLSVALVNSVGEEADVPVTVIRSMDSRPAYDDTGPDGTENNDGIQPEDGTLEATAASVPDSPPCFPDPDPAVGGYCTRDDNDSNNPALAELDRDPRLSQSNGAGYGIADYRSLAYYSADGSDTFFDDPDFKALRADDEGLKRARILIPWNVLIAKPDTTFRDDPGLNPDLVIDGKEQSDFDRFAAWIQETNARGIEQFVSLERAPKASADNQSQAGYLPSFAAYRAAVEALVTQYPTIQFLTAWNEPNEKSQPLYNSPEDAARFWRIASDACSHGRDSAAESRCVVLAGDFSDGPHVLFGLRGHVNGVPEFDIPPRDWGSESYFGQYTTGLAFGPGTPKRWAIHAYYAGPARDLDNNPRTGPTSDFRWIDKFVTETAGPIWFSEQNGLIRNAGAPAQSEALQARRLGSPPTRCRKPAAS